MPKSRIPSPARSQGGITPRRHKPRRSRSVCSPALSTASGRLTSVIDQFKEQNLDSFALSPVNRRSVLTDNTDIEEPRRKSWWKNLNENSRDVMELLKEDKATDVNNAIEDIVDIEVLSQEKKNYTLDLPESSDNESINSIVLPQRRLFTQKENQPQKFGQLVGTRETLAKLHKSNNLTQGDKTIVAGTKELFQGTKRSKPIFPAALLNISPNKTAADKTKENVAAEPKVPVRNIFGNRPANKRKNMFADFIVSESEDEISEIQPKVFGFQKKIGQQHISSIPKGRELSPTSSINTDIDLDDDWKHLPSSTMVENQLDDMVAGHTPVKRARLSTLYTTEVKEAVAEITANRSVSSKSRTSPTAKDRTQNNDKTVDKTKQADKSVKNKSQSSSRNKDTTKAEEKNKSNKSVIAIASERDQNVQEEDDDELNFTLEYDNDDEIEEQHQDNNAQGKSETNKLSNKTQNSTIKDKSKIENKDTINKSPNKTGVNRSLRSSTRNTSQNDDANKSRNRSRVNKTVQNDNVELNKQAANTSETNNSLNNANISVNKSNKSVNKSNKSINKCNKSINKSKKSMNKTNKSLNESLNKSKSNNTLQQKTPSSKATKTDEETQDSEHLAQDNIDGVLENAEPETSNVDRNENDEEQEMEVEDQESPENNSESIAQADESSKTEQDEGNESQQDEDEDEQVSESEDNVNEENNESQGNVEAQESEDENIQEAAAEQSEEVNENHSQELDEVDISSKHIQASIQEDEKTNKSIINKSKVKTNEHLEEKVNKTRDDKVNKTRDEKDKIVEAKADKNKIIDEDNTQLAMKGKNDKESINIIHKEHSKKHDIINQSMKENAIVNSSHRVNDGNVSKGQEIEGDSNINEKQEVENVIEFGENPEEKDNEEINKRQEVKGNDDVDQSHKVLDDKVNQSQKVQEDVEDNEGQKEQYDDEANESEEVQDDVEVNENEEVQDDNEVNEIEEVQINESQEVHDDDEVNESQEVQDEEVHDDDEANESQEVQDEEVSDNDEANETQDVQDEEVHDDDEVNESQELQDDDEVNESQEIQEDNESHEVEDDDEVNESQESEDDQAVNAGQEVEDDEGDNESCDEDNDEGNQSQEVEDNLEESNAEEDETSETEETEQSNNANQEHESDDEANISEESENEEDEANQSQEVEDQEMEDSADTDRAIATDEMSENDQEEMEVDDENEGSNEIETDNGQSEEIIEGSANVTHDTTGRNRKKVKSPEVILHDKTNQQNSFTVKGRNTSIREIKSMYKDLNIRPSLAPARDSIGLSDGTRDSSAEGSGWDSHRTTRKTLRQTFGKDFTPRKSLRALVMEKSAKQTQHMETLNNVTAKFPQANSTEYPDETHRGDVSEQVTVESDHELSRRTRQTTLEAYLQKMKQQNIEKKMKMEEAIRNSIQAPPMRDTLSLFKVPSRPPPRKLKPAASKPKKQIKSGLFDELPSEVLEDMKYKPPKRFQPANASWITKRLYKFLEGKLEPKYDYKARVRAEKLVETIYQFVKELRRAPSAPPPAVAALKQELARLDIVRTHFEFYEFFHEYMPREVRVKVVPDIVNKIPLPRHGVFSDIVRGNTVQG